MVLFLWSYMLTACSSQEDIDNLCDDVVVTYESFGQGFLIENCQACHASTSIYRHGAPSNVFFDEREDVEKHLEDIYRVVLSEDADMPPSGGITEEDLLLVSQWLICAEGL